MVFTAVIGGTGFDRLDDFQVIERRPVKTPYGMPSDELTIGRLHDREFIFLPRHGACHTIPPHRINYRANIHALKSEGAERIISFAAVGGIGADLSSGDVVIPDQVLDYTWGREHTFHEGEGGSLEHVDFTHPYTPSLRAQIIRAASRAGVGVHTSGTYAATQGPRLESAAEIDRLEQDGADIVGMTGMPEAALAREAGIDYAAIAIVVNLAAGRGDGPITMDKIRLHLELGALRALAILPYC